VTTKLSWIRGRRHECCCRSETPSLFASFRPVGLTIRWRPTEENSNATQKKNRLLHKNKGTVTKAAREAGKDRRCSFGRLIKKYEINRQAFG